MSAAWSSLAVLDTVVEILRDRLAAFVAIEAAAAGLTLLDPASVTAGDILPTDGSTPWLTVWDSGGSSLQQLGTVASGGTWDWQATTILSVRVSVSDGPIGVVNQSDLTRAHIAYATAIWKCIERWLHPPYVAPLGDPYGTTAWIWRVDPEGQGPERILTDPDRGEWWTTYRTAVRIRHIVRSLPPDSTAVERRTAWVTGTLDTSLSGTYQYVTSTSLLYQRIAGVWTIIGSGPAP